MAVGCCLLVDRPLKVERPDDAGGREVEDPADGGGDLLLGDSAGAEGLDENRDGEGYADGVGELEFAALGEAGGHDVFGHIAGHIGGGAVDLRWILAGEAAAAVAAHAAVGVDNDLAAGEAGVAGGAADDKAAGGIHIVLGIFVEEAGRFEYRSDDLVDDGLPDLFVGDLGIMLMRDNDGVHADRPVAFVLEGDLAFRVGAEPGDLLILAQGRGVEQDLVGIHDGRGHELGGLLAGKAEHHALVAGTLLALEFPEAAAVDALIDIGRLGVDGVDDGHRGVIEAIVGVGVADILRDAARDFLYIDIGAGGDFAADEDHAGSRVAFAGDMAFGIILEAGVEHRVGDLIAELVGMAFAHGFGGEECVLR